MCSITLAVEVDRFLCLLPRIYVINLKLVFVCHCSGIKGCLWILTISPPANSGGRPGLGQTTPLVRFLINPVPIPWIIWGFIYTCIILHYPVMIMTCSPGLPAACDICRDFHVMQYLCSPHLGPLDIWSLVWRLQPSLIFYIYMVYHIGLLLSLGCHLIAR